MQIEYDGETNSLRIMPVSGAEERIGQVVWADGVLDVAEGGRLVGVEVGAEAGRRLVGWSVDTSFGGLVTVADDGSAYVAVTGGDDRNVRSAPVRVRLEMAEGGDLVAVAIPRRGEGYEITYPSGNQ